MRRVGPDLTFAPTDTARFFQNPYISWMDRLHHERPDLATPDPDTEEHEILSGLGLEHERRFLQSLRGGGRDVFALDEAHFRDRIPATVAALHAGRDVIYQGALEHGRFSGVADFLVRVDTPSDLGTFSYEVWDTKLAKRARPDFLIQLCCYADILESIQGVRPKRVVVVTGDEREYAFRTDDYFYYYLHLKRAFLEQQDAFDPDDRPEPMAEGKNGRWETEAAQWLEANDHLSRVAGIRVDQIQKLRASGIHTMRAVADAGDAPIPRMRVETFQNLREQARLQIESKGRGRPLFRVLRPPADDPRRGLALLPPASPLDVAFDIEGYPLVDGGLEYLLGATVADGDTLRFHDWWAHNSAQEKRSFEAFVDWVHDRWTRDPAMHVYHYAAYEVSAIRRLMTKHGTREREVDDLLRGEVFVDLYRVVHQGVRIGTPSYSLKKVESLYLGARKADVATAADSIVSYQRWLEHPDGNSWETSKALREIRDYNEEDCISTWKLIEWLRALQGAEGLGYVEPYDVERQQKEKDTTAADLALEMLAELPDDRSTDPERWRIHELLAWLLEFHRRADKPMWWRMFDRRDAGEKELSEDLDCLAGLERTDDPPWPVDRSRAYAFTYDTEQPIKMREGKGCYLAHNLASCEILSMDAGRIEIKIGPKALKAMEAAGGVPHRVHLIPDEHVSAAPIAKSILRLVQKYRETGKLPSALDDLLRRRRPRVPTRPAGALSRDGETGLDAARAVIPDLDGTTLCIQGPPGTGKTYTGAEVIVDLLDAKKRIGIVANGHKAVVNLMTAVLDAAKKRGVSIDAVKVGGDEEDPILDRGVTRVERASELGEPIAPLIGGTAWVFSHTNLVDKLDYLFVDEAGQVSVANLVGMAPSARNMVLMGDQMQLSQPTEGVHPGESGLSCLEYLLGEHAVVPGDLGLFLATTWRMHPDVCRFISGAIYEDRLTAEPHTENRRVLPVGGGRIDREAGIVFVPVAHEGNRQGSVEEAAVVREIVDELLRCRYTDKHGNDAGLLTLDDILVVAPYNHHVRLLKDALGPSARVGTIDKFQGQEAMVAIVSMAASRGDASPRGIEFLFDRNRMNVAISRAMALAVVVGSPGLAVTGCSTVAQMGLVNVFCRSIGPPETCSVPV